MVRKGTGWPDDLQPSKSVYRGVIAGNKRRRLIVSPRGGSYVDQVRDRGEWVSVRHCVTGPMARRYFACLAPDAPALVLEAVLSLPDDPRLCLFVPFGVTGKGGPSDLDLLPSSVCD